MKKTFALILSALMLFALLAGCCGGETPAAPAETEITWDSYIDWLADTFGADSPDPEAYRALLAQAQSWEDVDVTVGPWDKLFAEDAFDASTWDEFVAAGGVGTYNTDFEDDALTGSGEPTGEASGEPAA